MQSQTLPAAEPLAAPVPQSSYWKESRRPLYSLALILPFVAVYEVGILLLRSDFINGGDAIVRTLFGRFFHLIGVKISFISLLILLAYMASEQLRKKAPWRLEVATLATAFFESLIWAVLLFLLLSQTAPYLPNNSAVVPARGAVAHLRPEVSSQADAQRRAGETGAGPLPASRGDLSKRETSAPAGPHLQDFILYCGAGVYEELVFRVFLFGLLMLVCRHLLHMESAYAAVWSVVLGAIIFSIFHHIGGEPFTWSRFLQRVVAGLYFAALYVTRSFGVAAATHSMYDIVVGLNYCI